MTDGVDIQQWVGKRERRTDMISAWPAAALSATLDRDDPEPVHGMPLPPGWHWIYFLTAVRRSEVGIDGHPKRGGFLPPISLPRRMWAGGRVEFHQPLKIGELAHRESQIVRVDEKSGASGRLVFVTVRHTVATGSAVAIVEEQDIVYREAAKPGDQPPQGKSAPTSATWSREVLSDPVLLFRYSALTFNAHRIHYDKDYATGEEHYPSLVVHGPLQTTLLLDLCRNHASKPVKRLEYRAMSPLFHGQPFTVNGEPDPSGAKVELWTAGAAGQYAMRGTAYL